MKDLSPATQEAFKALCAAEGLRAEFARMPGDTCQVVRLEGFAQTGQGPIRNAFADTAILNRIEVGIPSAFTDLVQRANLKLDIA
jgi:hypothetical protein